MNLDNIRKTLNSQVGKDLLKYLESEAENIRHIDNLKVSLNPIKSAIELRATQKTYNKLINIIEFLTAYSQEEAKTEKDSYE